MKIKAKLNIGIGLLCAMILALLVVGIQSLHTLKADTENILHANYNTLDYTKHMLTALETMGQDPVAIDLFERNLNCQQKNVTEKGEYEVTQRIALYFNQHKRSSFGPEALTIIRKDLSMLMALNMDAIARKGSIASNTAQRTIMVLSVLGCICFIIAFTLLLNLPGNIANPIIQLTESIKQIAQQNYKQRVHFDEHNEFGELARSFNLMAEKLEEYSESKLDKIIQSKRRIDTLINNMHDPVIGIDEANVVLFANQELQKIAALKQDDLVGRTIQEVAVSNDLIRAIIQDIFVVKEDSNTEFQAPMKIFADDKESYFQKEIIPIEVVPTGERDAQFIGNVIMLRNITPFKELDLAKTNFIATVSHELKTPLSSIKMSLQLLAHSGVGLLNKEQKELTQSIADDAERLLKTTGELLNLTQVESGIIQLSLDSVEPTEIVNLAIDHNRLAAAQKNIQLSVHLNANAETVMADKGKTVWVLNNLISNAIKYAPNDTVVNIDVAPDGQMMKFSVSDSGSGILPEHREKIFTRYFRVPGVGQDGTGLGLSISKEFIEAQKGRIDVVSEAGKGSVFSFWLQR